MKRPQRDSFQLSLFEQELLGVEFVAKLLGRSSSSIKRLLDEGKLRSFQHCAKGTHYILKASLDAYETSLRKQFGLDDLPPANGSNGQNPPPANGAKGAK
ncbi:MAG TPA: helix-turn-helix domain-containing protein [Candidatus Angelobacter sp.]